MLEACTRFLKLLGQMDRVGDAGGEHHGLATLAEPMPMRDYIADKFVGIHPPLKFANNVVPFSVRTPVRSGALGANTRVPTRCSCLISSSIDGPSTRASNVGH